MDHGILITLVSEAVYVFVAAIVVLLLCHRVKISPLVGLLGTGILIGPSGLALVDREGVEVLAELGVVLLLFAIGLEVSLARLRDLWRPFVIGGSLQVGITIAVFAGLATVMGFPPSRALFFGFVASLSSTVIVLKLYDSRGETRTPQAQVSLGILLFQDFVIVPMLVLTPVLAGVVEADPSTVALRFAASLAAVAVTYGSARYVMPALLGHLVATRIREVTVMGAMALCLGMAWLTDTLGLSMALGAFIAGLVVSETEYSHQVFSDMAPFRDLFASLFFVSIGMLVDIRVAQSFGVEIVGLAFAMVMVKALVMGGAVRLLGYPERTTVIVALGLAQVGEFAFVLMEVGRQQGLLEGDRFQVVLTSAVLTMLLTPGLVALAPGIADRWSERRIRRGGKIEPAPVPDEGVDAPSEGHTVVVGFGENGRLLARVLRDASLPYRIIELSAEAVRAAALEGEPILYGDSTRREILEHAGVAHASVVVFAISDPDALRRSVRLARSMNPGCEIIVRTRMVREIPELEDCGADQVIAEEFETAIEIYTRVLERYHVPRNMVRAQTRVLRGEGYRMLRAPSVPEGVSQAVIDVLAMGTTDIFLVREGSRGQGQTLGELALRGKTGAGVIAVVRGEVPEVEVGPHFRIEVGDKLVLVGDHAAVEEAFEYLDELEAEEPEKA